MKYIIVDDEPQARKLLHTYMNEIGGYQLVRLCATALEAYEALQQAQVDFMFLDIKMPVLSGPDFLRSLKHPPAVIFTTAYSEYALQGYELNVVDYLLKPIEMSRLILALEKLKQRNKNWSPISAAPSEHIFIKLDNQLVRLDLKDILLLEGMENYVKIHRKNDAIIASYTMKNFETLLPPDQFLRVHKSYIVPVGNINSIKGNLIVMEYKEVPVGASYRDKVMDFLVRRR